MKQQNPGRRLLIALVLAAGSVAYAADPAKPAVPPAISAETRAKFWRAQTENLSVQMQAEKAKAALDQLVGEMQKTCGDAFSLSIGKDGEPLCTPKPAAQ